MEQTEKWKVVCTGNIESGFSKEDVVNNLKILLQISNDQAEALISGVSTVVKKDLNQDKASQYMSALEKIGVQVRLEGMPLVLESDLESLPLALLEDEVTDAALVETGVDSSLAVGKMKCPKCHEIQAQASACANCGIIISRFLEKQQKAPNFVPPQQDRDLDQDGYEKDSIWALVTAKQIGLALLGLFILMKSFVWGG